MGRRTPFFWAIVILLGVYLLVRFIIPYGSMWILGSSRPLFVPATLMIMYFTIASLSLAIHITMSQENTQAFLAPIITFLQGEQTGSLRIIRLLVLGMVPLLVGWGTYSLVMPNAQTPTGLRIQHPTIPSQYEGLSNPFRNPDGVLVRQFTGQEGLEGLTMEEAKVQFIQNAMQEGRALYQLNCRPCHGSKADGNGPMAGGFRLRPVDFTDPGTIATVVEPYVFWRVKEGGRGLPAESTPWDSVMPTWKHELTDKQIWKIILAEYDTAGTEPRKPEHLE